MKEHLYDITFISAQDLVQAHKTGDLFPDDPERPGWYVFFESGWEGPFPERFDAECVAVQACGFQD